MRIKLGSPVFFTQERPGRDGKIFKLYKFRTMLLPKDGVIDSAQDAERLTTFGKKLRSTSLGELPELINIIKGDMAVVGPRPLDVVIGAGTVVMAGVVINPGSRIGKGVIVNTGSSIDHDCSVGNFSHIAVGAHLCGR